MGRLKLFIPLAVFIALVGIFFVALPKDPSHLPSALIGKPVPEFSLPVLGEDGRVVTDKDLLGKPYLLNVWATWCPTCVYEIPFFLELAGQGVPIIGLNYKDEDAKALQWLKKLGNPYQLNIVDTDGRLGLYLGVYGAPETFIVDAEGIVRYRHAGDLNQRVWQASMAAIYGAL